MKARVATVLSLTGVLVARLTSDIESMGEQSERYIRIALVQDLETTRAALTRIAELL